MSACKGHAPLSGAALMAICGDCGAAYDAAPPVHIRGPRAARAPRAARQPRRKRSEVIDTSVSIFQRSSVMTPLANERAPRGARRAVVSLTAGPAAVLEGWTPAPLAAPAAPPAVIPPMPQHAPRAAADVAPIVSRETVAPQRTRRPSLESETRAEYDRYILAMFERAQLEVNSFFDDAARIAGRARPPYTAWELFTHRKTVIAKWGSDELLTFFSYNRRLSYAQFREQYREGMRSEQPTEQDVA